MEVVAPADVDISFGEGDTAPEVTDTLEANGAPINLLGATSAQVRYRPKNKSDVETLENIEIVDGAAGKIRWIPDAAVPPGIVHRLQWVIDLASGDQVTVPNNGYYVMFVTPKP